MRDYFNMEKSYTPNMSHEICTGCSCCLLSCPVWNRTRDRSLTAQGRNKALQGGATVEEIYHAIDSCVLCGACEPNCPEENDIVGLTMEQRRLLNLTRTIRPSWHLKDLPSPSNNVGVKHNGLALLAGDALKGDKETIGAIMRLLGKGCILADDDGSDIVSSMEAGWNIDKSRADEFISPLRFAGCLVLADGLLRRYLRDQLPGKKIVGLGEALLSIDSIRSALGPEDLYVIESRGYHADYASLVRFYDRVRIETGAKFNLDLQRIALPTGASSLQAREDLGSAGCIEQVKWILQGRKVRRVIVEDMRDIEAFRLVTDLPVLHVALLAKDEK